ncbi:MAG TPA: CAP domain-containing protein [Nitrosopumilaceae archaeon]|nr:CAP domain-containing protein [Nitrosopumilaceae archaeon]
MGICSICHRENLDTISGVCTECIVRNRKSARQKKKSVKLVIIVLIFAAGLYGFQYLASTGILQKSVQDISEKVSQTTNEIENKISTVSPIQQPATPALAQLYQYALGIVNKDRKDHGLPPVMLSDIGSAQNHADDELKNNYFSHWNTVGVKPYVTYTELGGKNDMAENDFYKYSYCPGVICFQNNFDAYKVIKEGEYEMMYNDSQSNWGHRDNILEPHHTHVNFGIAYNHERFYFVEHFETNLISWQALKLNGNQLTMNGHYPAGYSLYGMNIFEDPSPKNITSNELDNSSPYNKGFYDQGNLVGVAVSRPSDNSIYVECSPGKIQLVTSDGQKQCVDYTLYDNSGVPNSIDVVLDLSKWLSQSGSLHTLYVTLIDKNGNQVQATSITLEDLK